MSKINFCCFSVVKKQFQNQIFGQEESQDIIGHIFHLLLTTLGRAVLVRVTEEGFIRF